MYMYVSKNIVPENVSIATAHSRSYVYYYTV